MFLTHFFVINYSRLLNSRNSTSDSIILNPPAISSVNWSDKVWHVVLAPPNPNNMILIHMRALCLFPSFTVTQRIAARL